MLQKNIVKTMPAQLFHFVMIKPTHYDDDGYPIQWARSDIPANTLAAVSMAFYLWRRHPAFRESIRNTPLGAAPLQ